MTPTRRDLQDIRRAIRQGWDIKADRWDRAASESLQAILDPTVGHLVKLQGMLLFTDAAAYGSFDVEGTLKQLLGRERDRQNGTGETDPENSSRS
jgi:hypothetical protein